MLAWELFEMATTREFAAQAETQAIAFSVNGRKVAVSSSPVQRLSRVLREDLGLTGTKVGCDALPVLEVWIHVVRLVFWLGVRQRACHGLKNAIVCPRK